MYTSSWVLLVVLTLKVSCQTSSNSGDKDLWESPMADFACQMCATGEESIAKQIIPQGYTCADLDIAMRNLGQSGCSKQTKSLKLLDANSQTLDPSNATQMFEYATSLQTKLSKEKQNSAIAYGVAAGFGLTAIIVTTVSVCLARYKINKQAASRSVLYSDEVSNQISFLPRNYSNKLNL